MMNRSCKTIRTPVTSPTKQEAERRSAQDEEAVPNEKNRRKLCDLKAKTADLRILIITTMSYQEALNVQNLPPSEAYLFKQPPLLLQTSSYEII